MAKKPITAASRSEGGFVLPTSLVMLTLLTALAFALFFVGRSTLQTSASAQTSTEAFYYAETAVNYLVWALRNDAEFDSHTYTGSYLSSFVEPSVPSNAVSVGDKTELFANLWDPGPTPSTPSDTGSGALGQVLYFDNSPLATRAVTWPLPAGGLTMFNISTSLPRYIRLEIDASGNITPAIPSLPHHATPVVGQDTPNNGAVVWLTAGDASVDYEISPYTPSPLTYPAAVNASNACVLAGLSDPALVTPTPQACVKKGSAGSWQWASSYGIIAYAVGYVNGKPMRLLRVKIM